MAIQVLTRGAKSLYESCVDTVQYEDFFAGEWHLYGETCHVDLLHPLSLSLPPSLPPSLPQLAISLTHFSHGSLSLIFMSGSVLSD